MPDRMNGQEGLVTDHDDVVKNAGVMVNSVGHGTATVKGKGSVPVTVQ